MPIDVVYTLIDKSKYGDHWELRYSLRSLAQQPWVRKVYLVGHKPTWVKDVTHIPCGDPYRKSKDANIISKVLKACDAADISERFARMSDDQHILRPITLEDLGPWLEPSVLAEARQKPGHTWCRRLVDTVDYCRQIGRPEWVFESHIPYLVDKTKYPAVMATVPWDKGNGLVTHIYLNLTVTETPRPATNTVRVRRQLSEEALQEVVRGKTFFNHNDQGLSPAVKAWMESLFPEPSPWEKGAS